MVKSCHKHKVPNPSESMDSGRQNTIRNMKICQEAIIYNKAQIKLHMVTRNIKPNMYEYVHTSREGDIDTVYRLICFLSNLYPSTLCS